MNWISEARQSWEWLQWMREVMAEPVDPGVSLPQVIHGLDKWNDAIAGDRHATGDLDRIANTEYFLYAAAMMSRAARIAIDDALKRAILWEVDNPRAWPSLSMPDAKEHWEATGYVITAVLQAWITLWNDLDVQQGIVRGESQEQVLGQWRGLADHAAQTVSGVAVAAWAQRR